MEICGGQTHAIVRYGIDGCCRPASPWSMGPAVRSASRQSRASTGRSLIAGRPEVIFCSFGDMLRVPGSAGDLLAAKARGRRRANRLFAARRAADGPRKSRSRGGVLRRRLRDHGPGQRHGSLPGARAGIANFSVLVAQVLVPPAMTALLSAEGCHVQGFLAAGHVCTVMGIEEYEPLARRVSACRSSSPASSRVDILQRDPACASASSRRAAPRSRTQYDRSVRTRRQPSEHASSSARSFG